MGKQATWFLIFCIVTFPALADEGEYAVSHIPLTLLKNSNVVKRLEYEQFTLKNPGDAVYKWKYVLTILNENGDRYAGFAQHYNKFLEIRSIEGSLYDAEGKELRKLKNKDIQDLSGNDDNNLVDDSRFKAHNFYYKVYPYTVAYEVELKYNGTMFYPDWFPQSRSLLAVEESQFVFSCPEAYEFRYKAYQFDAAPLITHDKGSKIYTWEIKNLPAIVRESYSPGIRKIAPLVLFGPTEFEMQDYKGNMKTWQDLGKFIYTLKQGRDALPDDVKQVVHQLTDKVTDPSQKVRILYEYLQKNTRYISIQLGIGGWQPFDAKFVAQKKYGDCKALSNYMYSLLKEAGISSRYAVIYAGEGEEDIFSDFPSSQFNHAILCVPFQKDTIWLECTDQFKASGYMGSFTGNRHALLVDENGGNLVRTPVYGMNENVQGRKVIATLEEDGTLQVKAATRYAGMQQDELQWFLSRLSRDKVKERLHEQLDFATYDVNQFEYTEDKKSLPTIDETLDITASNYATITGKRLFIIPNVMTREYQKLSLDTSRKYDIVLGFEYRDVDSVEIELPKGYETEALPKDVSVASKFGRYNSSVKLSGNKLYYYRTMERFSGRFPAASYSDLVKFYETIYKADRNKVVLVKNETPQKGF
jgi:transglutaminase-like putative cysteine protease